MPLKTMLVKYKSGATIKRMLIKEFFKNNAC